MGKELTREQRLDIIGRTLYQEWMEADIDEFPWEGAHNETERDSKKLAEDILHALEEAEGRIPKDRPPLPRSVREILHDHLTATGLDAWWTGYLRMDPLASEGHAREAARHFVAKMKLGAGIGFR
jgi:hypothetical protein